jgi:hypothetical protein
MVRHQWIMDITGTTVAGSHRMNETPVSTRSPLHAPPRAPEPPLPRRVEEKREAAAPVVEELDKYDISTIACTD